MDNRCTVCTHASLADIDQALMDGLPLRPLAAQYGLFASALSRHLIPSCNQKAIYGSRRL